MSLVAFSGSAVEQNTTLCKKIIHSEHPITNRNNLINTVTHTTIYQPCQLQHHQTFHHSSHRHLHGPFVEYLKWLRVKLMTIRQVMSLILHHMRKILITTSTIMILILSSKLPCVSTHCVFSRAKQNQWNRRGGKVK